MIRQRTIHWTLRLISGLSVIARGGSIQTEYTLVRTVAGVLRFNGIPTVFIVAMALSST